MSVLAIVLGLATIAISISTFRIQAGTQRALIRTQRALTSTWRTIGYEGKALESEVVERKLEWHLRVLRVLGCEWVRRPVAEQSEGSDR